MGFREARENEAETIPWLGEEASRLEAGYGRGQDADLDVLKGGMLARWPTTGPDDALDRAGVTFQLPRLAPGETADQYRGRLLKAWETWTFAGTKTGIAESLIGYGIADVVVVKYHEGHFTPGEWYSLFWVIIGPTMPFAPLLQGSAEQGNGTTQGSTATTTDVLVVKRQVLFWKSPHSYPVKVILHFDGVLQGIEAIQGAIVQGGESIAWAIGRTQNDTIITQGSAIQGGYEE